jgi:hypothetical protein
MQAEEIPEALHPLFWEHDIGALDVESHKALIILKVAVHGDQDQIRILRSLYGDAAIRKALIKRECRGLSAKHIRFWALIVGIPRKLENAWVARVLQEPWGSVQP